MAGTRFGVAALTAALLAVACSSSSGETASGQVIAGDESAPETTAPPTTVTESTTSGAEVEQVEGARVYPDLAEAGDGCTSRLGAGRSEFSFMVEDGERPVVVLIDEEAAAASEPALVLALHSPGWDQRLEGITALDGWRTLLGPTVFVAPRAGLERAPFWGQSDTFNVNYAEALFAAMESGLCFDPDRVAAHGLGGANFVLTEAICGTDIPLSLVLQSFDLISLLECDPVRPVPIISISMFEFQPNHGAYWDGKWNPPSIRATELTGGIGPVPEDLAEWAAVYGCEGPPVETTLPDPDDLFDRDTVQLAYLDCHSPLVAFGLQNGDFGIDPVALEHFLPYFGQVAGQILGAE